MTNPFKFGKDRRSIAALEFALIAPVLILLGLGAVEFSEAIRVELAADRVARTVANMIANSPVPFGQPTAQISAAALADYYLAGQEEYQEASGNALTISAASVVFTPASATGVQAWDAAAAPGSSFAATSAKALAATTGVTDSIDDDSVIVVQATTTYLLPFLPNFGVFGLGKVAAGPFTFTSTALARPRDSLVINKSGW
jgi:Flp pilus assembly protein TadG